MKYTIFGILTVMVCVFLIRSCTLVDKYSVLLGEYYVLVETQEKLETISRENIDSALDAIDILAGKNKELTKHITLTEEELVNTDVDIVRLERELDELRSTENPNRLEALELIVVNMESQLTIWKEKFTLCEQIVHDKDSIIFNLKQQYETQVNVSMDWENLYISEKRVRLSCENVLKITTRKLRTARFGGTFKTIAIIALGGYVAYKITEGIRDKQ